MIPSMGRHIVDSDQPHVDEPCDPVPTSEELREVARRLEPDFYEELRRTARPAEEVMRELFAKHGRPRPRKP